ncbi:MAG: cation transporter, partial [Parcubacteria group bacterium]|nr:cation transporter [Parcubacteria group bacterium]
MTKKTYKIYGMHCASCAGTIERVLLKTVGVYSAVVNAASESVLVEFDEKKISELKLAEVVESVGYKLRINILAQEKEIADDGSAKTILIKVLGMDSPHCAMVVEGALKKLLGVQNIDIDFSNQRAKVVFNPKVLTVNGIFKVIIDAGYKPIEEEGEAEEMLDKEKIEREKQTKTLKHKLVVGGILSVVIFFGSFPEWFSFIPEFLNNYWVLFILTTPVQFWVGFQFYSGLKLLVRYRTADMNTLIAVGTLAAYFYSIAVMLFPDFFAQGGIVPKIYFDTSAIIIVLILLGKYFEILMKGRASEAIKKLIGLQPKTATVLKNGKEIEISISEVVVGDMVVV